jgi:hypothetical protein
LPHGSITFYGPTFDALTQQQHNSRQNSPQPRHILNNNEPQHFNNNNWQSVGSGLKKQQKNYAAWVNLGLHKFSILYLIRKANFAFCYPLL